MKKYRVQWRDPDLFMVRRELTFSKLDEARAFSKKVGGMVSQIGRKRQKR